MHEQAPHVGGHVAETRTLDFVRQVEITFQAASGEMHTGKNPLRAAKAHLGLDGGILKRSGVLNSLSEGVKEGDEHRVLVVQVSLDGRRVTDVRLPGAVKASTTGGASPRERRGGDLLAQVGHSCTCFLRLLWEHSFCRGVFFSVCQNADDFAPLLPCF